MSRAQFFIIGSAVIFVLERVLPVLVSWPVFIFPVFAILFLLTSKNYTGELVPVIIAAFIFDFFSGYTFGFSALALIVVVAAIFLFKTRFNVNSRSFLSLAVYTIIFVFLYFALLSIKSDPKLMIALAPVIVIETTTLFVIFTFWLHLARVRGR